MASYKYVKEGNVVYDFLENLEKYNPEDPLNYKHRCISFHPKSGNINELMVSYKDSKTINTSSYSSFLRPYSFNPDQLVFHIEPDMWDRNTVVIDSGGNMRNIADPERLNGSTIPSDMVLVKIE